MSDCNHQCSSCASSDVCQEKEQDPRILNNTRGVRNVIGVVGGKGGVGKSLVTSLLAIQTRRLGYETAVLDADITGPSIPKIFGIHDHAQTDDQNLLPYLAADGTKVMSLNLLLEHETDPVFWRGPVISGVVKQFWEEVSWGDVDFMFVDMPPGTGDVPLTVFQSLPLDGIIIVSTPQSLVSMIVQKAVNMAQKMNIPVLGMVENMRFLKCPDCGKEIPLFGSDAAVEDTNVPVLERVPLDPKVASACDAGTLAQTEVPYLSKTAEILTASFGEKKNG
ncbi:Mrp/NBP35 family ATP-binding protein [uncultured Ruminococcus sp.]|uniref:Mrp/NBP35 family ATP-binding protein n=1 Tax=uncultured Ruminococcus sp. TaxID=165186 RepID=UPI0025D88F76|nr:Mrp/NBP35 family ATP-binding protein [uncultured Ruminococcus sp.]